MAEPAPGVSPRSATTGARGYREEVLLSFSSECGPNLARQLVDIGRHVDVTSPGPSHARLSPTLDRDQARYRAASARQDDLFATFDSVKQLGEVSLRFVDVDAGRHVTESIRFRPDLVSCRPARSANSN